MHPVLIYGCLYQFPLLVFLLVSVLALTSVQSRDGSSVSRNWLHDHLGSDSKIYNSFYVKRSTGLSPSNDSLSCEDLEGVGSFNTTCLLNSNLYLNSDIHIYGMGNIEILPHVSIMCLVEGCSISFNVSGNIKIGKYAAIIAGSVVFSAANLTMEQYSSVNTSSLGGPPPAQTSGTPVGYDGAGGGHGGRGASCLKSNQTKFWGGDVYAWSTLSEPWSYGSKGGGNSPDTRFGGNGGGRVMLKVRDILFLNGSVTAEGGNGGPGMGGGSGGSIMVQALKL